MNSDCIFCKIAAGEIPSCSIFEDDIAFAFLDIAPFTRGHALVIPKYHAATLLDVPAETLAPLILRVQSVARLIQTRIGCDGFNILQNNGACAGQTVHHVHFHIVPRWNGNDVTWTSGTTTPESLTELQRLIRG